MFSSPVVRIRCVGLGVACTFYVFLIVYGVTVVDGYVAHVGVGIIFLRFCINKEVPSVVGLDEAMIGVSKAMFGCSLDVSENIFGCSLTCAHAYLVLDCYCEVLTPFSVTVVTVSGT